MTDLLYPALQAPTFLAVRRRMFRQLLASLLYEDALRVRLDHDGAARVHGADEAGNPVEYRFTVRRRYTFDRVTVGADPVLRVTDDERGEAESLTRFLAEVRTALIATPEYLARFAHELEQTLLNDALAQYVRENRGDVLRDHDYDTLEGTVTDGHRYHPTYKSRIGFSIDDNVAYGPEFLQPVRPLWLAAHRTISEVSCSTTLSKDSFLRAQLGESAVQSFVDRIRSAGGEPTDYTLLPVHPWQWRERVASAFAEQLRRGELLVLGEDPDTFLPQQSIRTLSCRDRPRRPYLKLALSIVNTSTSRVLAPHTVGNAPTVSDWLRRVVASDEFLRDECRLILLGEVAGTVVNPAPAADFTRAETYGTLACIWRESLHPFLDADERAVPFTGLTACERDGTPLIDAWVRALGVRDWLRDLARASVIPLVHLLFKHGIACESHAQNIVLIHAGGVPRRSALKDFHDGVRFSRARLAEPERCPSLAGTPAHHVNANSFLETDDLDQVTDFLLDAFFFVNLGELSLFLADSYGLLESEFWATVRDEIRAYQKRFVDLEERFALFDVFKPTVEVEKLTTRRLLPDTEPRAHPVPNPLADSGAT